MGVRQCLAHSSPAATITHQRSKLAYAQLLLLCARGRGLLQRFNSAHTPRAPLAHDVYVQLLQIAAHEVVGSQVEGVAVPLATAYQVGSCNRPAMPGISCCSTNACAAGQRCELWKTATARANIEH